MVRESGGAEKSEMRTNDIKAKEREEKRREDGKYCRTPMRSKSAHCDFAVAYLLSSLHRYCKGNKRIRHHRGRVWLEINKFSSLRRLTASLSSVCFSSVCLYRYYGINMHELVSSPASKNNWKCQSESTIAGKLAILFTLKPNRYRCHS